MVFWAAVCSALNPRWDQWQLCYSSRGQEAGLAALGPSGNTSASHVPRDTTPTGAAQGNSVVKGISAAKLGGCLLTISLVEKYSFRGDFKHKHTYAQGKPAGTRAGSCEICNENQPAQWVTRKAGAGAESRSKLPGREMHSNPTPGFILHQVLPFTASPNTSKEVFLYSPGRSVNWPAASKAKS